MKIIPPRIAGLRKLLGWVLLVLAVLLTLAATRHPRRNLAMAAAVVTTPPPACGVPDDAKKRLPQNWTSFAPPERGGSYVDPSFGCTIVRLTDAAQDGVAEHHYYASLTPMSADDSKILINDEHGAWHVIDLQGNKVVPVRSMPQANPGTLLWDAYDGNVFYFTHQNSLMKAVLKGHNVESSPVHTFNEYKIVLLPDKTDLSIDGQSFAMWGGDTTEAGRLDVFTYNMRTGAKKRPYETGCTQVVSYIQGPCVHGITQTADDNVVIDFANDGTCKECGNRLWNGSDLSHVQDITNHMDTGYDLTGASIVIDVGNSRTLKGLRDPCPSGWGVDVRSLTNPDSSYCLLDNQPDYHVSYRGRTLQPWVAFSFTDGRKPGPEYFNNNSNFQAPSMSNWKLYEDELILARIDGKGIFRLAHARSRSAEGFWAEPRAAISRDGKYVIFDSNMAYAQNGCPTGLENCADVYLIRVR